MPWFVRFEAALSGSHSNRMFIRFCYYRVAKATSRGDDCSRPVPHVQSEAVAQIEYDASTRALFVQFTSGEWYGYLDVPADVHVGFEAAESYGRFFQDHIRDRYAYKGPLEVPA